MKRVGVLGIVLLAVVLGVLTDGRAAVITHSLGNTASGFSDGDKPAVFLVGGAQALQPVPFDQGYGTDGLFGGNFSVAWTHSFGAIADPILSASITIGIYDHDSAATGSQLSLFSVDSAGLTAGLDAMFEAAGDGEDMEYNEYSLAIPGSAFGDLADGSAMVSLDLQGPGLVWALFPSPPHEEETTTNGANIIFSTLNITTQDPGPVIPEPSTFVVWGVLAVIGGVATCWRRRRRG
jgi:hypothetical protein